MTLPGPLPYNPGVSLRERTIAKTILYAPHSAATVVTSTISIGARVTWVRQAKVFMPPGTNGSVRIQLGFNGQRMIPTIDPDDYIYGSGVVHVYPWNIQVSGSVNVWAWCWNANQHEVQITLDLDDNRFIPQTRPIPQRIEI